MAGAFLEKPLMNWALGLYTAWILAGAACPSVGMSMAANEVQPGVIELRPISADGIRISEVHVRQLKRRSYLYFCVQEQKEQERCFYAEARKVGSVKSGMRLAGIVYSLSPRVYNDRGLIKIGTERYFYPILRIRPLST